MTSEQDASLPVLTGEVDYPTSSMMELSRLASALINGDGGTDEDTAIWPLLAVPGLVDTYLGSEFATKPNQILVHGSLLVQCCRPPDDQERYSFSVSMSGSTVLGIDVRIANREGADLAALSAQLRWIETQALNRLKPIALSRATRGRDIDRTQSSIITQVAIDRFVKLSGDPNPLHTDRAYAVHAGLNGTIVPGAMLAALVEPALRVLRPEFQISCLSMTFLAPMIGAQAVQIAALDIGDTKGERVRVFLSDGTDHVAAIADVSAGA